MSWELYIPLSLMMFFEYAVWGAWAPVLAARLLGPLKMTGKQTGWIYSTIPLACMVSPLIAGPVADRWVDAGWILIVSHAIGAVLLFAAANAVTFGRLFSLMMAYAVLYAATMPLVNSLMFYHLTDPDTQSTKIFIWAPVAWALVGWMLAGWRQTRKVEGDGKDCLILAGVLSVAMAVCCVFLPATPPQAQGGLPILDAFAMLKDPNILTFFLISFVVTGMMQFYFLGTAQFMQDMGISSKYVPAAMALAQIAQAIATWFALGYLLGIGFQTTLSVGALCWLIMYGVYVVMRPASLIVASQVLHGLAYVFFIIAGQIYADKVGPPDSPGSAQALVFAFTLGLGLFLGTQLAGIVMDRSAVDGKFQWRKVWTVPGLVMLAGLLALVLLFHD